MWLALLGGGIAQSIPSESGGKSAPGRTRDAAASLSSPGGAARPSRMALRATFAAVALGAAAFALQRLPAEIAADPVVSLASRIVNGLDFDPEALERYEPHIRRAEADESCGPLRAAVAAIRTYRVQQAASANDAARALENVRAGLRNLRQKLACAPQDGLSWFTLFTLEASLRGRAGTDFPLLLMSYRLAPNEGHLMRMRSQIGTAVLRVASPKLQGYIREEFVRLARDDTRTAAGLIAGAGEPLRAILVPLLERVGPDRRADIARQLDEENFEVTIPGVPDRR